ncbi:hypothetical protein CKAN_01270000 [Cinnamomum micranthum f. kanehirae]|uniref:Uncharacterized protein n=1 Tax=Cinnamomum micranthum f. kanehirae TaxID=337451 RepID=A0A443NZI6_9MAGN|nr:hypothetical protein CKAN_01270000 [Cinnamomum micranthum f. kanehirae]
MFADTSLLSVIHYHVYHGNLKVPLDVKTVKFPALRTLGIPDIPSFFTYVGSYPAYMKLLLN